MLGLDDTVDRLKGLDFEELGDDEETVVKMFLKGKELYDDGGLPHRPVHFELSI